MAIAAGRSRVRCCVVLRHEDATNTFLLFTTLVDCMIPNEDKKNQGIAQHQNVFLSQRAHARWTLAASNCSRERTMTAMFMAKVAFGGLAVVLSTSLLSKGKQALFEPDWEDKANKLREKRGGQINRVFLDVKITYVCGWRCGGGDSSLDSVPFRISDCFF